MRTSLPLTPCGRAKFGIGLAADESGLQLVRRALTYNMRVFIGLRLIE